VVTRLSRCPEDAQDTENTITCDSHCGFQATAGLAGCRGQLRIWGSAEIKLKASQGLAVKPHGIPSASEANP